MSAPTVHILLATYNGAKFLDDQLHSIEKQAHKNWTLTVSDDGSTDETIAIVSHFSKRVKQSVRWMDGPGLGSTRNFFHLLQAIAQTNSQDLFAFCDQDDFWQVDKLRRAVDWHSDHTDYKGRLYCGKTQYVDEQLRPLRLSRPLKRPPSFSNAMVENIASGNTMVMDATVLHHLLKLNPAHSVWHDWTAYLVTTATGGLVGFDDEPCVLYRQHRANLIGSNDGMAAHWRRLGAVWGGRYRQWAQINLGALQDLEGLLTCQASDCVARFQSMRDARHPMERLRLFMRSDIRRQSALSNAAFLVALAANKV